MIKKLQNVFPTLIFYSEANDIRLENYDWFITKDDDVFGISNKELTKKDQTLLATLLQPYYPNLPLQTKVENVWINEINGVQQETALQINNPFRFVYFSITENQINPVDFREAINELFAKEVPILWENENEGILIEGTDDSTDTISYEHIINLLMSDLYVNINFYVGPFRQDLTDVKQYFHSILDSAKLMTTLTNKSVMTYIEAIPFLLMNEMNPDFRTQIAHSVLQEFLHDEETLKMIATFFECNLNISETAKKLYMHRNSLQYRLDRFHEKTTIDIRQFNQAMTVYLALRAKDK
ncbi:MAG TPA: helix-turn-helix domain-containing protein [Virgibacillus sp.]|nr:helix-turn-helix domain-containing protein [Virgibacillus sp.]